MKEDFEWIHSWTDYSNNNDLPRILLIGDSITEGYNRIVREKLRGVCYVDYIATSYPINRAIYQKLVSSFENDSIYDLIHFNNGLHGIEMKIEDYEKFVNEAIDSFKCKKIIMATSTRVNVENGTDEDPRWSKVLKERNSFIKEFALKNNYKLNNLNELSQKIDNKDRLTDGYHYQVSGYEIFAQQIVKYIRNSLNI